MKKFVTTQKRNFVFLLVMSLFLCNYAGFAQDREEINRLLTRAKTAYSMGNYEDALTEYKKVQQMAPKYPDLYKAIADVYEKLGSADDLKNALESYNTYLRLAPESSDREAILEKTASIEYMMEKQIEKNIILDDFSGIWISNLFSEKTKLPPFLFKVMEVGKTGKFRITILPESGFYRESIIDKVVNVVPDNKNGIRFTFADAQAYVPGQAGYDFLRGIANIAFSNNSLAALGTTSALSLMQENDLPSKTQTAYNFDLKYDNGTFKGYCNIIKNVSDPKRTNNQDELFEITLKKDNQYYYVLTNSLSFRWDGAIKNANGKILGYSDVKNLMQIKHPDLWKQYKSGNAMAMAGVAPAAIGIVALVACAWWGDLQNAGIAQLCLYGGLGLSTVGWTLAILGSNKMFKASKEYDRRIRNNNASYLNFGLTPSGNLGAVFTF